MRKVTLSFGLLAGVIVSVLSVIVFALCENGAINFDSGDFITYGSMVIALAMVFFGIKSYRDIVLDPAGGNHHHLDQRGSFEKK